MIKTYGGRWTWLAAFPLLLLATSAFAQEQGKDVKQESQPRNRLLIRSGYTRPGSPADKIGKNGEIIQAALEPDASGRMIGATVYFAVFKNVEDDLFHGDPQGLVDAFVAGRSFENSLSPRLDRKARYLYLYQIVNDHGLNPPKDGIVPAVAGDVHTAPIDSCAVRLIVDPRYITSWGHFTNIGFDAHVTDRKVSWAASPMRPTGSRWRCLPILPL
jgi:hypothetical protein